MPTLQDIFDIPEQVHQGDFVLKLSAGGLAPDETVRDYVVTPELARCFDEALGIVKSAVLGNQSKGAYLHGSFGAGKSHFMAILSLLLAGNAVSAGSGMQSVVLAWDEQVRYTAKRNGYHGGANPAECLVPCVMLVRSDRLGARWQANPLRPPAWWGGGSLPPESSS